MTFGEIYKELENGAFVSRELWEGSFLWLKKKASVKSEWCKDPILKMIADANGGQVDAEQTICRYNFKDRIVTTGFVPQQDDMAANDWLVVKVNTIKEGGLEIKVPNKNKTDGYVGDLFDGADVFKKP